MQEISGSEVVWLGDNTGFEDSIVGLDETAPTVVCSAYVRLGFRVRNKDLSLPGDFRTPREFCFINTRWIFFRLLVLLFTIGDGAGVTLGSRVSFSSSI